MTENLIELGRATKPHGIKGAATFVFFNPEEAFLEKGDKIFLFPGPGSTLKAEGEEFTIESINYSHKIILILEGLNDRNMLESFLPFTVKFPRKNFPKKEEGEYYADDLIGLTVLEFETEKKIGTIESHMDNGAQTVIEIRGEKNFEIPMVDNFVKNIDFDKREITVVVPEYIDDK